jgi:hypothetical protein
VNLLRKALAPYAGADLGDADLLTFARLLAMTKSRRGSDCWLWTGRQSESGYGVFKFHGRPHRAHRVAYLLNVGPIPADLELDHLCRVPLCVNPNHLEPVTGEENRRRHRVALGCMVADETVPQVLTDVISVMVDAEVKRMHTADVLAALATKDRAAYVGWDAERLASVLESAGISREIKQIKIDGVNRNGWRLLDLMKTT